MKANISLFKPTIAIGGIMFGPKSIFDPVLYIDPVQYFHPNLCSGFSPGTVSSQFFAIVDHRVGKPPLSQELLGTYI